MSRVPSRSSDPTVKSKKSSTAIDLTTAKQMLPLVRSIVSEIVESKKKISVLGDEQDHLDRNRRSLDWSSRSRRYHVAEERTQVERNFSSAMGELSQLGVTLIDPVQGTVDFPTRINGRPAAFIWQLGEERLQHWHYDEEDQRRPIPPEWQPGTALRMRGDA